MLRRLISASRAAGRARRVGECLHRGVESQTRGDIAAALKYFRSALSIDPAHVDALCLAAGALRASGDAEGALEHARSAARIAPGRSEVLLLLASLLPLPQCRREAIDAIRRLLALTADSAELGLHRRLAELLREEGAIDEAIAHFRSALAVHGDTAELNLHAQLANLLHVRGHAQEAREHYARAHELARDESAMLKSVTIIPPIPRSRDQIAEIRARIRHDAESLLERPLKLTRPEADIGHTDFYLAYHGADDRPLRELLARLYLHAYPDLAFHSPYLDEACARRAGRRRIGVISKYLHEHTIGRLNAPFLHHLDRSRFALTVFTWGTAGDAIAQGIRADADVAVTLGGSIEENRIRIAGQRLDLLLYCDIGMEPMTYWLAFARLAPVQCVTWGHPVTTGLPHVDYFISSELIEAPGSARHYSEELACIPKEHAHVCYPRPTVGPRLDRRSLGVCEYETIYACVQTLFKLHPDFDDILRGILNADPRGIVLLIDHPRHLRAALLDRWRASLGELSERIRFLPPCDRAEFLGRLATADVILDTPHFSGGNSSLEALAAGTPVVTLPGEFAKSRLTLAAYRRMGVDDCVASDARSYIELAVKLGTDAAYRSATRSRIAAASHRLFDDVGTVRALERIFDERIDRARRDGPLRGRSV